MKKWNQPLTIPLMLGLVFFSLLPMIQMHAANGQENAGRSGTLTYTERSPVDITVSASFSCLGESVSFVGTLTMTYHVTYRNGYYTQIQIIPVPHMQGTGSESNTKYIVNGHLNLVRSYPIEGSIDFPYTCLLYTSPSPRDRQKSRMPSSA